VTSVFVVRGEDSKGTPDWCRQLEGDVRIELCDRAVALNKADLVTTATNSKTPVIPTNAAMPRVRHLNLIGSNHKKRKEIPAELAYRCLPPNGYLVVDDTKQARLEAGDFVAFGPETLNWDRIPTLGQLLDCDVEKEKASKATLTAFKSVGIGLMDLAVAAGVCRRLGLLTNPSPALENAVFLR
jgi:ornithine cyclodeaminase/alanine dehydrogenase-like protein (mu-crystallin family)